MDKELEGLLNAATYEIQRLRRDNEILSAKVEMIDLFANVLYARPSSITNRGMGEDIASKMQRYIIEQKNQETKSA